ncbi:MAG: hypothetical protein F6K30_30080, partial [Cyanothece sp. SIO2G6]|nr:hypothetical protein [Cyanothece sp. SIO2G6]
ADGTVLSSLTYEREPGGEPTKITREDGSYRTFVYDTSLRLEQESFYDAAGTLQETITYTYDADGKRLAHSDNDGDYTYTYGDGFQLESVSNGTDTESYSHDEDGRLESITRDGETLNLNHNATDKLTLITNASTGESITYFYDAEGDRIGEQSSSEVTQYLVAPSMGSGLSVQDLVTDGSGNVLANHVYVGNSPLMRLDGNNDAVYYLTDAMGSVVGLVDENGEMVASFDYDGFGNVRTTTGEDTVGEAIGGDYRFQSQWLESESGLYYFRARDYDAHTGQFLSRDPVDIIETAPESFNPYQFVYNNSLIYSDPTGEFTITELNASQKIQSQLSNIQRYSGHKAKEYLVERLGDGISEIVASTFNYFLPTGGGFGDNLINLVLSGSEEASELFEFGITSLFCEHFEGLPLASSILLYPGIKENGEPRSQGINCAGEDGYDDRTRRAANHHSSGLRRPEFIFMSSEKFQNKNPNSYLVGDVKIIQHAAYKSVTDSGDRGHGQWKCHWGRSQVSH